MIVIADPSVYKHKEDLYVAVRNAEGRIVDDDLLKKLPVVPGNSLYANEWKLRGESLSRFTTYLRRKYGSRSLNILDIGCGNGWLTRHLFDLGHRLVAVDLNTEELQQAERVFGGNDNLKWVYADVMEDKIPGGPFDIILLSASCQYFGSIAELTDRLKSLLANNGEIHLLDSIFYRSAGLYEAKARSVEYYSRLGFPEMAQYYFHHTVDQLKSCGYKKLYPGLFSFNQPLQWWVYRS